LTLQGVISCFETCKPTWAEYKDPLIPQVVLTLDEPWSPSSDEFAKKEVTISKVSQVIKDPMLIC